MVDILSISFNSSFFEFCLCFALLLFAFVLLNSVLFRTTICCLLYDFRPIINLYVLIVAGYMMTTFIKFIDIILNLKFFDSAIMC
jgi:hypothetical protein